MDRDASLGQPSHQPVNRRHAEPGHERHAPALPAQAPIGRHSAVVAVTAHHAFCGLCQKLLKMSLPFRVRADPTPWEGGEGGSISTRLDAGRALKARLELVPQKDGGTRITLHASGTVLILGRREILKAVAQHIDELTEIS